MIKHIVLFQFIEPRADEHRTQILEQLCKELNALPAQVPGLVSMETGINLNPEESYHLALTATFQDMEGVKAYAVHPAHVEVAVKIRAILEKRACVDYAF